jgi:hypothetical protein
MVGAVRRRLDDFGTAQNFIRCDRDQALLLPPSMREWLAEDHLACFVLDAMAELELDAFYGSEDSQMSRLTPVASCTNSERLSAR